MNLFIYLPLNLQSKPNEFAFACRDFQLRPAVCGKRGGGGGGTYIDTSIIKDRCLFS